jgi:hypothetical protein
MLFTRRETSQNASIHGVQLVATGRSTAALIEAVVQTNVRAMQELLRAENPKAMLALQQRFACDYIAVLMRGTMALVAAIESTAAG